LEYFSGQFESGVADGDLRLAKPSAQPCGQGKAGSLVNPDFAIAYAFDQGQPVAGDCVALSRAKKRVARFAIDGDPDHAGGTDNAQSVSLFEAHWVIIGEAELT